MHPTSRSCCSELTKNVLFQSETLVLMGVFSHEQTDHSLFPQLLIIVQGSNPVKILMLSNLLEEHSVYIVCFIFLDLNNT